MTFDAGVMPHCIFLRGQHSLFLISFSFIFLSTPFCYFSFSPFFLHLHKFLSLYIFRISDKHTHNHSLGDQVHRMSSSSGQSSGYDLSFKILLIGDSAVGKSSLLVSFISNSVGDLAPTIGNSSCLLISQKSFGPKQLKIRNILCFYYHCYFYHNSQQAWDFIVTSLYVVNSQPSSVLWLLNCGSVLLVKQ